MGTQHTQPDMEVLKSGRKEYAENAAFLIEASQVVAIHFQTVAKANNYWGKIIMKVKLSEIFVPLTDKHLHGWRIIWPEFATGFLSKNGSRI